MIKDCNKNSFENFLDSLYGQDVDAFEDGYQSSDKKKNHLEIFHHFHKGYLKIKYSTQGISIDKGYKLKSNEKKLWKFTDYNKNDDFDDIMQDVTYEVKKYINKYFKSFKILVIRK